MSPKPREDAGTILMQKGFAMTRPDEIETYLKQIADALERLAPSSGQTDDPKAHPAYIWTAGRLKASQRCHAPLLDDFQGVDTQRAQLLDNCLRLARGHASHDVLLWGARGMGKSSLVRAVHAHVRRAGHDLALVQVYRDDILDLPALFDQLAQAPRAYMIFIDDLSFEPQDRSVGLVRSLLEGGVDSRPNNMRLFVTSNRRHMVSRSLVENEAAQAVNARDVLDDRLALADRFGLSLGFHACDQKTYLAIVAAYAQRFGLSYNEEDALQWAVGRSARSGRTAWQYVQDIAGRAGRAL